MPRAPIGRALSDRSLYTTGTVEQRLNALVDRLNREHDPTLRELIRRWNAFADDDEDLVLEDGDKGDITVSVSGTVWTIDNDVVTYAKMQDMNTDRLLGRDTAGVGDVEELTVGSGISFSGSGGIVWDGVTVRKNTGADVGTRRRLNLIEGSNVTLTVADDGAGGEVDITVAAAGGVTDHGALTGLADDDHSQYLLLAGRVGGQTAYGGTASGDDLNLIASSHATKGHITLSGLKQKSSNLSTLWLDTTLSNVALGAGDAGHVGSLTGTGNVFVGHAAGRTASSAVGNVAVGYNAAYDLNTGDDNVVIGYQALSNGDHSNIVAVGSRVADAVTGIATFVVIGTGALGTSTQSTHATSVLVGTDVGAQSSSAAFAKAVAIGYRAHYLATDTNDGVVIGYQAADSATSADGLTVIGSGAGTAVTTGGYNTLIGYGVAPTLTTGTNNVVIGAYEDTATAADTYNASAQGEIVIAAELTGEGGAEQNIIVVARNSVLIGSKKPGNWRTASGTYNIAVGHNALPALTTGASNTVLGSLAGSGVTTGEENTIVGESAGQTLTTGSRNVLLGESVDVPAAGTSDHMNLGGVIFGDLSGNDIRIGGSGAVSQTERLAVTDSNADTTAPFSIETTGSNGAKCYMLVGTQDPSGTVSAVGGSVYFRVNGASSKVYQNTTAGTGTTWTALF